MAASKSWGGLATLIVTAILFGGAASADGGRQVETSQGYIFVNGDYIPAPYQIEWSREALRINGMEFGKDSFDLSRYSDAYWRGDRSDGQVDRRQVEAAPKKRRRGRGRKARAGSSFSGTELRQASLRPQNSGRSQSFRDSELATPFGRFCSDVVGAKMGAVIVLFERDPPLCLDSASGGLEVLESLYDPSIAFTPDKRWIADDREFEVWARLMSEFRPSVAFTNRAESLISKSRSADSEGEMAMAAAHWIDKVAYPLTVFAMAVVVLGFGHLLNNKPKIETDGAATGDWSEHRKVVGQSVLIIGLLSAVDLILTIGTANAGLMRELNPLGSGLIDQPMRLFLFKATLTAGAVGILFWLHRRPAAQVASWWCCLLLTLLTARWVVFQSMFL